MTITFLCPKGHTLTSLEEQAGQAAECPECGARFRIPTPAGSDVVPPAPPVAVAPPTMIADPQRLEFLCPQGHRLHGPVSMAGKAGQCPQCGTRFRFPPTSEHTPIVAAVSPVVDDSPSPAAADDNRTPAPAVEAVTVAQPLVGAPVEPFVPRQNVERRTWAEFDFEARERAASAQAAIPAVRRRRAARKLLGEPSTYDVPPLARWVERFWKEWAAGATLELLLASGEKLQPERYAIERSRGSHAFFAVREGAGNLALIALPWTQIVRVTVRGVKNLPHEFS